MSGSKRSADTLNTIGIVVVGVCGAVLVYVTITALQAFYVNDTSDIQTMADYGGQDTPAKNLKAQQMGSINEYGTNTMAPPKPGEAGKPQTFRMPIKNAKALVTDPKAEPSNLVPALGPSNKPTVMPIYGRPKALPNTPPPPGADGGSGSAAGSGSGSGPGMAFDAALPTVAPTGAGSADAGAGAAKNPCAGSGSAAPKGNGH